MNSHINHVPLVGLIALLVEHFTITAEIRLQIPFRGPFLESPEKPFVKLRLAYSVKLVFSYLVTGI